MAQRKLRLVILNAAHVEVLNKDLHICTLDSKAKINMTLNVDEGKGMFLL